MSNWHNRIECVWCGMLVTQSCLTLCDPVDCSLLGSSVLGILQATILEWVVNSFSRGSSPLRDQIQVSCFASRFFTIWATREVFIYYIYIYIYIYISQLYLHKAVFKKERKLCGHIHMEVRRNWYLCGWLCIQAWHWTKIWGDVMRMWQQ